jgi:AraC family transcriptional regulator, transcriptional activator of the genes for pyochelin and ferripyochelin receptors
MISHIEASEPVCFTHVESSPLLAVGFHLHGGTQFDVGGLHCVSKDLQTLWSYTPQGTRSAIRISEGVFTTVSLRFEPVSAEAFLQPALSQGTLRALQAPSREHRVQIHASGALDPRSIAVVRSMLDSPYRGRAHELHLEAGALALLAEELGREEGATARMSGRDRCRIHRARDLLHAQLTDPPSLVELARQVGLNEFKLKRDFKRIFGTTVFGYVRVRRMELAALQLRQGMPVIEVAAQVGYVSPGRFAIAFRRHFGVRPSAARYG